jgi:hypothetical protein
LPPFFVDQIISRERDLHPTFRTGSNGAGKKALFRVIPGAERLDGSISAVAIASGMRPAL